MSIFSIVKWDEPEELKEYLDNGGDVDAINDEGKSLLWIAASSVEYNMCKILLEAGANPLFKLGSYTLLHRVINSQFMRILDLLLEYIDLSKLDNDHSMGRTIIYNIETHRGYAAYWNKILNMVNGTMYGRGRK